jgi:hypothetical protein
MRAPWDAASIFPTIALAAAATSAAKITTQLSLSSCSLALLRSGVLNPSVNHS